MRPNPEPRPPQGTASRPVPAGPAAPAVVGGPRPSVAIDGPAGAGKSTLARSLAAALGVPYVNTGVMYRALAARALANGVAPDDPGGLERVARGLRFELDRRDPPEVSVRGLPPGADLTAPEVEAVVSATSRHPAVRDVLRERQRELAAGGCVMEGRDIGTVVLPDATVKIYLSASPGVRAGRRASELGGHQRRAATGAEALAATGAEALADAVAAAVARRDALDARTNPFVPASDAHVLDTTGLSRPQVLARAIALVRDLAPAAGARSAAPPAAEAPR